MGEERARRVRGFTTRPHEYSDVSTEHPDAERHNVTDSTSADKFKERKVCGRTEHYTDAAPYMWRDVAALRAARAAGFTVLMLNETSSGERCCVMLHVAV